MNYSLDTENATDDLLAAVWKENKYLFRIFSQSLSIKLQFEKDNNMSYPGYRYFNMQNSKLQYSSTFSTVTFRQREEAWMDEVSRIWISACFDYLIEIPATQPVSDK